jgi:hypothetical protein
LGFWPSGGGERGRERFEWVDTVGRPRVVSWRVISRCIKDGVRRPVFRLDLIYDDV